MAAFGYASGLCCDRGNDAIAPLTESEFDRGAEAMECADRGLGGDLDVHVRARPSRMWYKFARTAVYIRGESCVVEARQRFKHSGCHSQAVEDCFIELLVATLCKGLANFCPEYCGSICLADKKLHLTISGGQQTPISVARFYHLTQNSSA